MTLYTFLDFLSSIGGFMGLILSLGALLSEFLTEGLFIASLMKMLTAVNLVRPKSETLR